MFKLARALPSLALTVLLGHSLFAQELASVAGTVRDTSGGAMPGVLVEVSSPALIEKVRSTTTDGNGQYRIAGLPVGTYTMTFALTGFSTAKRPDVLLCDEPTGALDISTGIVVLEAIERVCRELGTTVVVITHNAAIAEMADRVVSLFDGRISDERRNSRRLSPHDLSW